VTTRRRRAVRRALAALAAAYLACSPMTVLAQEHGDEHRGHHGMEMGVHCTDGAQCASGVCREVDGVAMCTRACERDAQCGFGMACGAAGICEPAGILTRVGRVFGDRDFVGALFNFVCLIAIIYFGARKPLGEFLRRRRRSVEDGLEEAKNLRQAARKLHRRYSRRLEKLDQEMDKIRAEMVRAGEAERDRLVQEAETKAARMRREVDFLISQQLKQLREDLMKEAVEAAVEAAELALREKTTGDDQTRLARSYLGRLGEGAKMEAS